MLSGKRIGFAITGSFCTHPIILTALSSLVNTGADVLPILSKASDEFSTRFMKSDELKESVTRITGHSPITSIVDAEPIGPMKLLDCICIVPCTGNTIAKLTNSITDSPVLMACKSVLRNNRPVIIAVSTNDGLSGNAANIGRLLAIRNYYFVPFGQDDCIKKPSSLVADFSKLNETVEMALQGIQLQPILA